MACRSCLPCSDRVTHRRALAEVTSSLSDLVHGPELAARGLGVPVGSGASQECLHLRGGVILSRSTGGSPACAMTGGPGPSARTRRARQGDCSVSTPPTPGGKWGPGRMLLNYNCGHACQSHFYKMFFLEEESVVDGSFSRIQLLASLFCF